MQGNRRVSAPRRGLPASSIACVRARYAIYRCRRCRIERSRAFARHISGKFGVALEMWGQATRRLVDIRRGRRIAHHHGTRFMVVADPKFGGAFGLWTVQSGNSRGSDPCSHEADPIRGSKKARSTSRSEHPLRLMRLSGEPLAPLSARSPILPARVERCFADCGAAAVFNRGAVAERRSRRTRTLIVGREIGPVRQISLLATNWSSKAQSRPTSPKVKKSNSPSMANSGASSRSTSRKSAAASKAISSCASD